jgi:hypothetical protein
MPFKGNISKSLPYVTEVTPATTNTDATAVTYMNINDADKLVSIDTQTIPTTSPVATSTHTLGAHVVRVQIQVSPPPNGLAQVRVVQGTTVITADVIGDTLLLFDAVP